MEIKKKLSNLFLLSMSTLHLSDKLVGWQRTSATWFRNDLRGPFLELSDSSNIHAAEGQGMDRPWAGATLAQLPNQKPEAGCFQKLHACAHHTASLVSELYADRSTPRRAVLCF